MTTTSVFSFCCTGSAQTAGRRVAWPLMRAGVLLLLTLGWLHAARADVTATITGTVTDPTGAVLPGVRVKAINTETQVTTVAVTNHDGVFSFILQPATYDVVIAQTGFKAFRQETIHLNVSDVITVNAALVVGDLNQVVNVTTNTLQPDTISSQIGQVIEDEQMVAVPLNGRSYTDLLDLQPGVASGTSAMVGDSATSFNFQSAGFRMPAISGEENPGNQSVNGMRETSNGFLLNGVSVEEYGYSGTAVVPNLDSLAEFRILTSNFDAEYGNFAGGQVNVITKGGTNTFHGNVFEFLRNTDFDAANYFDNGNRGPFQQNQFGGTLGGPITKDHVFFFGDYQQTRNVVGVSTGTIAVPTSAERSGDFSAQAADMAGYTVQGAAWASTLSNELGYNVTAGEPYYSSGCASNTACVFPNAQIPASAISPIAANILKAGAIPVGNGSGTFTTSAYPQRLTDNKGSGRVDANTRLGSLFGYYNIDQFTLQNPYPVATVPGFSANTTGRSQVVNAGDTNTLGSSAVNEVRIGYLRLKDFLNTPATAPATLSSLGFASSTSPGGITPLNPQIEGIPEMDFESFDIGVPSRVLGVVENTYQAADNYSQQIGKHSFKAGAAYHFTELTEELNNVVNGYYFFDQTLETGVDFADFLVGAPGGFEQGEAPAANTRSYYLGLFAQDSWRVRPNLSLNYGIRWDVISPWWEKHNELEVLKLGEQSVIFPNSPTGWVFPGDPGIPRTVAPIGYHNFAPRIGMAWSPAGSGPLHWLTGDAGKTSVHAGYGMFYTAYEGGYDFSVIGDAPYGYFYEASDPSFANPYQTRGSGAYTASPFPYSFPPTNVSASHPDPNVPASAFGVIGTSPSFNPANKVPYAEQYELSLQRQLSGSDLLSVAYVGTQGHRLLVTVEANPVNQAACYALYIADPSNPSCGPNNEPTSLRGPFGANFGSEGYFSSVGASSYNSFQVSYQHRSKPLQFLVGYTVSKSLDYASGFGEQVNPFNPKLTRGLSSFDQRQNFVVSYNYNLPFKAEGGLGKAVNGWALSGITQFSTGLPVFIFENDDHSLLGTDNSGPMPIGIDTPDYSGGAIHYENPRSAGHPYFDSSQFSAEPIGQLGTSRRSFFAGPGLNNFDTALLKNTNFGDRFTLQFRAEFFNIFNHTQFANVDGNYNSATFGQATTAADPRIGQLALKLMF